MHATRDTSDVIFCEDAGGRVMRSVGWLISLCQELKSPNSKSDLSIRRELRRRKKDFAGSFLSLPSL
jgi:hypothetical protein